MLVLLLWFVREDQSSVWYMANYFSQIGKSLLNTLANVPWTIWFSKSMWAGYCYLKCILLVLFQVLGSFLTFMSWLVLLWILEGVLIQISLSVQLFLCWYSILHTPGALDSLDSQFYFLNSDFLTGSTFVLLEPWSINSV